MNGIKGKIDQIFIDVSGWAYRRKYIPLVICLLIIAASGSMISKLRVDSSVESFFYKSDPAVIAYDRFKDQFGKDDFFFIGIETEEIFSAEFLGTLKKFHRELEDGVPYLDEVQSLANARKTTSIDGALNFSELLEKIPETEEKLNDLRADVFSNPFFANYLVSTDGKFAAIILKPAETFIDKSEGATRSKESEIARNKKSVGTVQYFEMIDRIREIAQKYENDQTNIYIAGHPVITTALDSASVKDISILAPLSFLITLVFLILMFRRPSGVIFPLLVVLPSVITCYGIMAALGIPLSLVTNILATFMLVVGMADSVHVLAIFYRRYSETGDKLESIQEAYAHTGLAILMTSFTTALGLLTFAFADIASIAHLGIVAPIGIFFALFYTTILIPSLIAIFPVSAKQIGDENHSPALDRFMKFIAAFSIKRRWEIIIASLLFTIIAAFGAGKLRISHNAMKWFDEEDQTRIAVEVIDSKFAGALPFEITIDTGVENGVFRPEFMQQLEKSARELEGYSYGPITIGKAISVADVVKEINRALNDDRPDFYKIPESRELIAQELLMFEMDRPDDLASLVSSDNSKARLTLLVPFDDAILYEKVIDHLDEHLRTKYPDSKVVITGVISLFFETVSNILSSMVKSYTVAYVVITLSMIALIGSLGIGLLSMLPNFLPILAVFGLMGFARIPFDFSTMLIGSIGIGLVVDDTVHYVHTFRRLYPKIGDAGKTVVETTMTTGRAIVVTSLVLAAGFVIYLAATMKNFQAFGLLMSVVVLQALLADLLLLPALLIVYYEKGPGKN